jgi:hypothetical protein
MLALLLSVSSLAALPLSAARAALPAPMALADTSGAPACPPEVLANLYNADFLTVRNLRTTLPHGQLTIEHGVVAAFKGEDKHTAGIVIGDMDIHLDKLPQAPGTFQLLPGALSGPDGINLKGRMSYLMAGVHSQAQLAASQSAGASQEFIAALRRWKALTPAEQAQFEAVYKAAWADGWKDERASAQRGQPVLREPVAGEVFGAMWLADIPGMPKDQLTRVDIKVEADGQTTSAREHRTGQLLFQTPAAPPN